MSWWNNIWPFKRKVDIEISESKEDYSDWDYEQLCELYYEHPWLAHQANHEGFEQLWFDYNLHDERIIIKTLLKNFKYLTFEEAKVEVRQGLSKCMEEWDVNPDNTIFVGIRKTKFADGSGMFLQLMKNILIDIDINWEEHNLILEMKDGIKYAKAGVMREQNQVITKVVLVDDFIGTGETAKKQIKIFIDSVKEINENVETYFFGLGGMSFGVEKAEEAGTPVYSNFILERGIDISFPHNTRGNARNIMLEMEGILADQIKGKLLADHSMGWGGAESLYTVTQFNIPNNVFPIFWWKKYKDDSIRKTLFNRMQ
ncbi:MAG: hypothetical protein HRT58_14755 [Crocinitomicaceae bacterium]|nr:hypothetical protein [Flavobacteriales bacterium]NQZ36928.1 hypothetical protein [Crocinitomicaceae bacterium]